jgi:hypothetical protein
MNTPSSKENNMSGIDLIIQERARQIEQLGFTPEHDAQHTKGELAWVACYYAMPGKMPVRCQDWGQVQLQPYVFLWQTEWHRSWAKRDGKDRLRQVVVAAALLAAEADRLLKEGQ